MKLKERFKVGEFKNPSGEKVFRVFGYKINGERVRQNFPTAQEAIAEKQKLEVETLNHKISHSLKSTRLTDEQLGEAELAIDSLDGKPLMAAVRFYMDNFREPLKPMLLVDALKELEVAKEKAGRRPDTVRNIRVRVGAFIALHAGKMVSDILPDHVREFVYRHGVSHRTQGNDRRALSCFFTWAKTRGYCLDNPISGVDTPTVENGEPVILTLAEVRRLMEAARIYKDGRMIPYVALAIFAAIRPTELARITWDNIDLEAGTVTIGAKIAKMRQRRIVEMVCLTEKDKHGEEHRLYANLIEWLAPHAVKRTPIKGENWRRDFDAVKELAGFGTEAKDGPKLKPWVQDSMRHTGISFHLAHFEHEGKTAAWAGNSSSIVHKHYKGLVKKSDTQDFWSIRPDDSIRTIVKYKAAATN